MIKPFQTSIPDDGSAAAHERWFSEEVHSHDSAVKAYLRNAFPSVSDIDDVVQESYLRLWRLRAGAPIRSAKALLFTVARRLALDWLRRKRRSVLVLVKDIDQLDVLGGALSANEADALSQKIEILIEAVDSLPVRCREIFMLCHMEGRTQREVASRLGLSENTVAVQCSRGLQRCEEFMRRRLHWP